MHHAFPSFCLAGIFDFNFAPHMIAIVIPVAGMVLAGVIVYGGMYFHHRRLELWHETARIALEKGQPLPPPLENDDKPKGDRRQSGQNDFRAGLILVATGAGLYLFLDSLVGRGLEFVGAIPGFIGVALLLHGLLSLVFRPKASLAEDRSGL